MDDTDDQPLELADGQGADGTIKVWVRPEGMSVEEFMRARPEELGDPDYETENVVLNQWWVDLYAAAAGTAPSTISITALALGTGGGIAPARTETAMVTEWKRYSLVAATPTVADPPSCSYSFFAPASDGAITLTEAGLLYSGATLVAGTGKLMSHAAFAYGKPNNQDVRIDYTLARSTAS